MRRGTGSRQQPHCSAPRRGSELADGCNSDDKQTVCGGDQPSHRVLEMSTGRRKSCLSTVGIRMRLGGCEEQALLWNGRGYINPTKGGRGGDSEGTILRI